MNLDSVLLSCLLCRNVLPALHVYSPSSFFLTAPLTFFLTQCQFGVKALPQDQELKWKTINKEWKRLKSLHISMWLTLVSSQTLTGGNECNLSSVQGSSNLQNQCHYFSYTTIIHISKKKINQTGGNHFIFNFYWTHYIPDPVLSILHVPTQKYFKTKLISNWNYFIIIDV